MIHFGEKKESEGGRGTERRRGEDGGEGAYRLAPDGVHGSMRRARPTAINAFDKELKKSHCTCYQRTRTRPNYDSAGACP